MFERVYLLRNDLSHVLWIGGTACSGKTTVARLLAQKYDLRVYHRDEHQREHLIRATPEKHPTLHRAWADRENWEALYRQPAEMVFEQAKAEAFEAFEFILDDLLQGANAVPLIAEGIGLFPELVARVSSPDMSIVSADQPPPPQPNRRGLSWTLSPWDRVPGAAYRDNGAAYLKRQAL